MGDTGPVLSVVDAAPAARVTRLTRQLEQAESGDRLVALHASSVSILKALLDAGQPASEVARLHTQTNDVLVRRVVSLAQRELGPAPLTFCWVGLGSEGRGEQTLKTDQDNALIYEDPPADLVDTAARYFGQLAERVVAALESCGLKRCQGEIMASNERWRQSLSVWRGYFSRWVHQPEGRALLNAAIFFDLRPIAGDSRLTEVLWSDLRAWIPASPMFSKLLLWDALAHRPPLGLFGRFVVERAGPFRGAFDIKWRGLMPVVEPARVYALSRGLTCTNTIERLRGLEGLGEINQRNSTELIQSYEFVMGLRMRHQLEQLRVGQELDDYVFPDRLERQERGVLKTHLRVISHLQGHMESQLAVGLAG